MTGPAADAEGAVGVGGTTGTEGAAGGAAGAEGAAGGGGGAGAEGVAGGGRSQGARLKTGGRAERSTGAPWRRRGDGDVVHGSSRGYLLKRKHVLIKVNMPGGEQDRKSVV